MQIASNVKEITGVVMRGFSLIFPSLPLLQRPQQWEQFPAKGSSAALKRLRRGGKREGESIGFNPLKAAAAATIACLEYQQAFSRWREGKYQISISNETYHIRRIQDLQITV